LNFRIAATSRTTGNLLSTLVTEKARETGVTLGDSMVCYGSGYSGNLPVLNARCSTHNKEQQTRLLWEGLGPGALEYLAGRTLTGNGPAGTWFARKEQHSRGRDISVVLEPWQFRPRLLAGADFFTKYEPSNREFRIWMYRNRYLGGYEKVLGRPEAFKKVGRNYDNGFNFNHVEADAMPQAARDLSASALRTLGLDFGAIDMLQRPDESFCVLEVNSAPGVAHERRSVINNLATRIVRWAANGYPARS